MERSIYIEHKLLNVCHVNHPNSVELFILGGLFVCLEKKNPYQWRSLGTLIALGPSVPPCSLPALVLLLNKIFLAQEAYTESRAALECFPIDQSGPLCSSKGES